MSKPLAALLIVALVGSAYSNWKFVQKNKQTQLKISDQAERIKALQAHLDKVSDRFKADADAERQVIDQLKQRLKAEQDNLSALDFDHTRAHNGGVGGDDPANYNEPIRNQQSVVQDLQSQLDQLKNQGAVVSNAQKQALGETKYEESTARQQIDAAIQLGQQNLESLQSQRKALQPHIFENGVNDQVKSLTQQIKEQQAQLQSLRSQRKAYDQQGHYAENTINSQTGSQLNDIQQARAQLAQRLKTERAALNDLQQKQKAATQSRNNQKSAINQVDQAYQAQKQKVQQLQDQLKTEEARLQALTI
jgi:chromosome segregation ATPase